MELPLLTVYLFPLRVTIKQYRLVSLLCVSIPPSATLLFDIEVLSVKDSTTGSSSGVPKPQPGQGLQIQPGTSGLGTDQPSLSQQNFGFLNNPQISPGIQGQPGLPGQDINQQSLSQRGTGFQSNLQADSQSSFQPANTALDTSRLPQAGIFQSAPGMPVQNQGLPATSSATGLGTSMSGQGLSAPNQGSSSNILDLATQGQGFTAGIHDFSSPTLDSPTQTQGSPTQNQPPSFSNINSVSDGSAGQQMQSLGGQSGPISNGQSLFMPSGQGSFSQPTMDMSGSQFPSAATGLGSRSSQFQTIGQRERDSSAGNVGFGSIPDISSNSIASRQPNILNQPGFPDSGRDTRGDTQSMNRMFDRQRFGGERAPTQRFDSGQMFGGQLSRPGMPIRMMNTEQPSTRMQPVREFSARNDLGRGMPGMGFGMNGRGMRGMSRAFGGRGIPEIPQGLEGRVMPGIGRSMMNRGMPFMGPRESGDPRFRGMAPPGRPGFPGTPGMPPVPQRGMPPRPQRGMPSPMMLQRLRMMQRLRGF